MKPNLGPIFVAILCINFAIAEASITNEQIEIIRKLPVQQEFQEDLITHFDQVREWIIDLTLSTPRPGRPYLRGESVECVACRVVLNVYMELMKNNDEIDGIIDLLKLLGCAAADFIDFLHPDVCTGALDMYKYNLHYIIQNNPALKPTDVCTIMLGKEGNCRGVPTPQFFNWTINIKGSKPPVEDIPYLPDNVQLVKILQLTDIHLDLDYEIGKNTKCGKPMCCQSVEEDGVDADSSAGPHGDYKCDMPFSAMNELFEKSANMEGYDYEFVMMTGDIPPHNVWSTTLDGNLAHYKAVNDKLVQLFQIDRKVPIYPVIGNHEPHPCNTFPPKSVWNVSDYDISWMYGAFADAYQNHINDSVAVAQLRDTGYYTLLHKDTNLRIIVINTNFGYRLNFWLYYDLVDPQDQLQWLADTLAAAEEAKEVVYILGHMPPGNGDCWTYWSSNFEKIIVRFESIIKGQFYGHTHKDEIEIFYDFAVNNPRPVSSLFVGASTTALTDVNPGYKVYYANGAGDEASWEIMDHETWTYNLTEANNNPNAPMPWKLLYRAKEAFGLKSLRPKDLDNFVYRMLFDDDLFEKYHRFYHTDSQLGNKCETESCKMSYICDAVIANSNDYTHCERFRRHLLEGSTTSTEKSTTSNERISCQPVFSLILFTLAGVISVYP